MAIVINGSGTVTGLAVGGLPDGTVDAGTLATNSVDSAELVDGSIDSSHLASGVGGVAGITSSADATAITIDSSEQVGIGQTNPSSATGVAKFLHIGSSSDAHSGLILEDNNRKWEIQSNDNLSFFAADVEKLKITSNGRGKSQFTIAAWVNFNGTGTVAIRDSHNVSSMGDWGTGQYGIYFTSGFANSNYAYPSMAQDSRIVSVERDNGKPDGGRLDVSCERSWDAALTDNETLSVLVIGDQS